MALSLWQFTKLYDMHTEFCNKKKECEWHLRLELWRCARHILSIFLYRYQYQHAGISTRGILCVEHQHLTPDLAGQDLAALPPFYT